MAHSDAPAMSGSRKFIMARTVCINKMSNEALIFFISEYPCFLVTQGKELVVKYERFLFKLGCGTLHKQNV